MKCYIVFSLFIASSLGLPFCEHNSVEELLKQDILPCLLKPTLSLVNNEISQCEFLDFTFSNCLDVVKRCTQSDELFKAVKQNLLTTQIIRWKSKGDVVDLEECPAVRGFDINTDDEDNSELFGRCTEAEFKERQESVTTCQDKSQFSFLLKILSPGTDYDEALCEHLERVLNECVSNLTDCFPDLSKRKILRESFIYGITQANKAENTPLNLEHCELIAKRKRK